MRYTYFWRWLFFIVLLTKHADATNKDSLENLLTTKLSDSVRVKIYQQLLETEDFTYVNTIGEKAIQLCDRNLNTKPYKDPFFLHKKIEIQNRMVAIAIMNFNYSKGIKLLTNNIFLYKQLPKLEQDYQFHDIHLLFAYLYNDLKMYDLAKSYLMKIIINSYKIKNPKIPVNSRLMDVYFTLAEINSIDSCNIKLRIGYTLLALHYATLSKNTEYIFNLTSFAFIAYTYNNDYTTANYYFKKAQIIFNTHSELQTENYIQKLRVCESKIYIHQKKYSKAFNILYKVYTDTYNKNAYYKHFYINLYKGLSATLDSMGNNAEALHFYKLYTEVADQKERENIRDELLKLETNIELGREQLKTSYLMEKSKLDYLQSLNRNKTRFAITISALIALLVSMWIFFTYRKKRLSILTKELLIKKENENYQKVVLAQEDERKRIATDLHDGLGQLLIGAKMNFMIAKKQQLDANPTLEKGIALLDESYNEIKHIAFNLMPTAIVNGNLENAIVQLNENLQSTYRAIEFKYTLTGLESIKDIHTNIHLFRILQELYTNSLKHANASLIELILTYTTNEIRLVFKDNGIGIDSLHQQNKSKGNGLSNVRARVELLKGTIRMDVNNGTSYLIII